MVHARLTSITAAVFDLDQTLLDQKSAADAASVSWAADHGIADADVATRWSLIATERGQEAERGHRETTCEGRWH